MPFEVKDRKAADVSQAIDMDCELPEEVHNRRRAVGQRETEDEWGRDNRQQLADEDHDFHVEKRPEFCMDLTRN